MALYIIYCIYNNIMRKNSSYTDVLLCYLLLVDCHVDDGGKYTAKGKS